MVAIKNGLFEELLVFLRSDTIFLAVVWVDVDSSVRRSKISGVAEVVDDRDIAIVVDTVENFEIAENKAITDMSVWGWWKPETGERMEGEGGSGRRKRTATSAEKFMHPRIETANSGFGQFSKLCFYKRGGGQGGGGGERIRT